MTRFTSSLKRALRGTEAVPAIIEYEPNRLKDTLSWLNEATPINLNLLQRFNMVAAILPTDMIHSLDRPAIKTIYLDRQVRIPEMKEFAPTFNLGRGIFGLGLLSKKRPLMGANPTSKTFKLLGVDEARKDGFFGSGVRVGIVDSDSGLRVLTHPQIGLRATSLSVRKVIGGATSGHGSHVGTTIQGSKVNIMGLEVEGGAPLSSGVYVKALLSPLGTGTISDILKGIDIALNNGSQVINLSLGSPPEPLEDDPMHIGLSKVADEAVFVAATGNDGTRQVSSPANSPHTIAVSAIDPNTGTLADFSNYGPEVDFTAPGVNILSGIAMGTMLDVMGRGFPGYSMLSGTSMATPHISAMIALFVELMERVGVKVTTKVVRDMAQRAGVSRTDEKGYGLLTWSMMKQYGRASLGTLSSM